MGKMDYNSLFEKMSLGVVYQDTSGKIIDANPAAELILGYSVEQMNNMTSDSNEWDAQKDDGAPFPANEYPSMLALTTGKIISDIVMSIYHPKRRSRVWINICATPEFKEGEKKPFRVFTTFSEISDKFSTQKDYQALLEKSPLGIAYHKMIYDESGNPVDYYFLDANENYLKLTGIDPRGKMVTEAFPGIEKDPADWIGTFARSGRDGENIRFQQYLESVDRWYDVVGYQSSPDHFVATFLEITEQKKKEQDILELNTELKEAQRIGRLGSWIWDLQKNHFRMSDEQARIFGIENPENYLNIQNVINDYIYPEDKNIVEDSLKFLKNRKIEEYIKYRIIRKDSSIGWIKASSPKVKKRDENGNPVLITGTVQDITEIVDSETALKAGKEQLDFALAGANDGLWDWNLKTEEVHFDDRYYTMAGYQPKEFEATFKAWEEHVHTEDLQQTITAINQCLSGKTSKFETEFRFLTKSGSWMWIRSRGKLVEWDINNKPIRFIGTHSDITRRKEAEIEINNLKIKQSAMIANISDVIAIIDKNGIIKYKSPNITQQFGWKPEELVGKPTWITVHPDDTHNLKNIFSRFSFGSEKTAKLEFRYKHKNGKYSPVHITARNMLDNPDINGILMNYHDISERKEYQEKLQESEKQYRTIVEDAPIGILYFDKNGVIYDCNNVFVNIIGSSKENLIGLNMFKSLNNKKLLDTIRESINKGESIFKDWYTSITGNKTTFVRIQFKSIANDIGEIVAGIGIVEDITDTKKVEGNLQKSEEKYRELYENNPTMYFTLDQEGNVLSVNQFGAQQLGYSIDELIGGSVLKVFHPDDKKDVLKNFQQCLEKSNEVVNWIFRKVRKDGSILWVEEYVRSTVQPDGSKVVFVVCNDISKRIENQNEIHHLQNYLSNIINSMPSIIIGVDPDVKITQWNKKAESELGLLSNEVINQSLDKVFPQLNIDIERVKNAIKTRQIEIVSKQVRNKNNQKIYENITVYPLTANGIEGAVIRVDDITERVRIEEMMIQSEKMLSVGGLAAGMAHEINNPLAGIMQNASVIINRLTKSSPKNLELANTIGIDFNLLLEFMEKRKIIKLLKLINSSVNRASVIVMNMLSFARMDEETFLKVDIRDTMDEIIELIKNDYDMRKRYDFKKIKIIKRYEQEILSIPIQESKIKQVIMNILKNGAEAMSDEKIASSEDSIKNKESQFIISIVNELGYVRFEIENNGPQIPNDIRKRIFEPFFTTKSPSKGTGLGLSISYFIICEGHNGEMFVENIKNSGAKFIVRLPIERNSK